MNNNNNNHQERGNDDAFKCISTWEFPKRCLYVSIQHPRKKPRYYITSKSAQEGVLTTMIYERFIPFMERNRQKGEHVLIYTGKNLCLTTTDLTQFRPTETKMTRFIRVKGTFNFRCLYCKHSFITFYIGFKQARKMLRCLWWWWRRSLSVIILFIRSIHIQATNNINTECLQ